MYEGLGYTVYRTVLNYYMGEEDAYDMRKVELGLFTVGTFPPRLLQSKLHC
jgi:hypothetical protein